MENPYFNIFYSFSRGTIAENQNPESLLSEKALENNISRAFFSTLKNLEEKNCVELLKKLILECKDLKVEVPTEKPYFIIQHNTNEFESKINSRNYENRFILVINGYGDWDQEKRKATEYTIPDGWIFYDKIAICVEAKLLSYPSDEQLKGHFDLLKLEKTETHIKKIHWEDIEFVCRNKANDENLNFKDKFLFIQLADFLEYEGFGKLSKIEIIFKRKRKK
jgi:hypothetical protein